MSRAGLVINPKDLASQARATFAASLASIIAPFLLAFALAAYLHPRLAPPGVDFTNFALLIGAGMTITAFPMLAKLLLERNILGTPLGTAAVACSWVAGVATWCILAHMGVVTKASA